MNHCRESPIAVVGAGLMGRTLSLVLLRKGYRVTLFDKDNAAGKESCAHTGAGMLASYCELETSSAVTCALGNDSAKLWSEIIRPLNSAVFLQNSGTIVLAHPADHSLLDQFYARVSKKLIDQPSQFEWLDETRLAELEPNLTPRFSQALYAANEGQIDNRQLLEALADGLIEFGCDWKINARVHNIQPVTQSNPVEFIGRGLKSAELQYAPGSAKQRLMGNSQYEISVGADRYNFDLVIDCRGMGAKDQIEDLRGVRGEMIEVYAPEVVLNRPIRLLHPRYPIYIVPRPDNRFLIGATSIECEDYRSITVLSTLELLSAAYSLDPSFAQASIVESRVNCRPAFSNNEPRVQHYHGIDDAKIWLHQQGRGSNLPTFDLEEQEHSSNPSTFDLDQRELGSNLSTQQQRRGLIRVNGLYRHGFLVTPKLVSLVVDFIECRPIDPKFICLFEEEEHLATVC